MKLRYLELATAVATALATAVVSLAVADIPANFWQSTKPDHGHPGVTVVVDHHTGLEGIAILLAFVMALVLAVTSLAENLRQEKQARARSLDQSLALALVDVSDCLHATYKAAVDKVLVSFPTVSAPSELGEAVRINGAIPPSEISMHLHRVHKRFLRATELVPAGWFGLRQNLRDPAKKKWQLTDYPLGTAYEHPDRPAGALIGQDSRFVPELPAQTAVAFAIRDRSDGTVLGVVSIRAPAQPDVLLRLLKDDVRDLLDNYLLLLAPELGSS